MSTDTSAAAADPVKGSTAAEISSGTADPRRWLALADKADPAGVAG